MERRSLDLDHLLDEPFVQVLPNGRSLRMNRAFRELAAACQAEAELASIFGPSVHDLLSEADANGRAGAYLAALRAPAPGRAFRVLLKSGGPGGPLSALGMGGSGEVAWRRAAFE